MTNNDHGQMHNVMRSSCKMNNTDTRLGTGGSGWRLFLVLSFLVSALPKNAVAFGLARENTPTRVGARTMLRLSSRDDAAFTNLKDYQLRLPGLPRPPYSSESAQSGQYKLDEETKGLMALAAVPLLGGTYIPLVQYVNELEMPMPGFLFSSLYFSVAAVTACTLSTLLSNDSDKQLLGSERGNGTIAAGVEMGFYVVVANVLTIIGLETVSSDRSGFLIQLTTIIVPLLAAVKARDIKEVNGTTWLACLLALLGMTIMSVDPMKLADTQTSLSLDFSGGESWILGAAVFYSFQVVRISDFAQNLDPIRLSAAKAIVEAIASWGIVVALLLASSSPDAASIENQSSFARYAEEIHSFILLFCARVDEGTLPFDLVARMSAAILWTGAMCTAGLVACQAYGQRLVKPSDANLIYSTQPLFTAAFAYQLLGEQMNTMGYIGGAFVLCSVFIVAGSKTGAIDV